MVQNSWPGYTKKTVLILSGNCLVYIKELFSCLEIYIRFGLSSVMEDRNKKSSEETKLTYSKANKL